MEKNVSSSPSARLLHIAKICLAFDTIKSSQHEAYYSGAHPRMFFWFVIHRRVCDLRLKADFSGLVCGPGSRPSAPSSKAPREGPQLSTMRAACSKWERKVP